VRIAVKVHRAAEAAFIAWRQRNSQPPGGDPALAQFHEAEMFRQLIVAGGVPAGAEKDESVHPPIYGWRYSNDTWVRFIHRDEIGRFGGRVRKVIIIEIVTSPSA
jgi:hypothetical protein